MWYDKEQFDFIVFKEYNNLKNSHFNGSAIVCLSFQSL